MRKIHDPQIITPSAEQRANARMIAERIHHYSENETRFKRLVEQAIAEEEHAKRS